MTGTWTSLGWLQIILKSSVELVCSLVGTIDEIESLTGTIEEIETLTGTIRCLND